MIDPVDTLPEDPPQNGIHAAQEGRSPAEGTAGSLAAQEAVSAPQDGIVGASAEQSPSGRSGDQTPAKVRRPYPQNRKKADRPRNSYRAKSPEARQRQLAGLIAGRGRRRKFTPPVAAEVRPTWDVLAKQKLTMEELYRMSIIDFARDALGVTLYPVQETILRGLYGLPLSLEQIETYRALTGAETYIAEDRAEGIFILGARSGKSFLASIIALYEATARAPRWRERLNPGETGYIVLVATREKQAMAIIGRSCARLLENSRIANLVAESWASELALKNGITIVSMPCSATSGRGLPICGLILDELGWFRQEGAKADTEIYDSLRPRMAQFRGAKFLAISTPSSKAGLLWQLYNEGPVPHRLTVRAATTTVNPTIDPIILESEQRRNPDNYRREFLAEFAETLDSFFPPDALNECFTLYGDVKADSQYRYYCGVDQSGLSGADRFGMAIAHREGNRVVADVVRSWSLKDGDAIIGEIKAIAQPYNINAVCLDRYAGGWCTNAFQRHGFEVTVRRPLPEIYINLKSLVISRRVAMPDTKGLREGLGRTMASYGKSNSLAIVHERTTEGHGDEADATATATWLASSHDVGGYFSDVLG